MPGGAVRMRQRERTAARRLQEVNDALTAWGEAAAVAPFFRAGCPLLYYLGFPYLRRGVPRMGMQGATCGEGATASAGYIVPLPVGSGVFW